MSLIDASLGTIPYVDPETHEPLDSEGNRLITGAGGRAYDVQDGIPVFLRYPSQETKEESDLLARLNEAAVARGWRRALDEAYGERSKMTNYVTDPRRLGCLDLIPLAATSTVLEIGSGLGQFTVPMASKVGRVCAVEIVPQQARFAAERCRQSGLSNVQFAVGGDDCRLPFRAGTFDVAVCNLVLEWCAGRTDGEPVEAMQRRLVSEIARVLKPGGTALISTKNRYALKYVFGSSDEHVYGMRFGSALPRPVLSAWLAVRGKKPPRAMLHSHNRLKQIILEGGFGAAKSYWAAPEMRFPSRHVPTDAASIRQARREGLEQGDSPKTRLLMPWVPAGMVRHVMAGLTFVARKGGGGLGTCE